MPAVRHGLQLSCSKAYPRLQRLPQGKCEAPKRNLDLLSITRIFASRKFSASYGVYGDVRVAIFCKNQKKSALILKSKKNIILLVKIYKLPEDLRAIIFDIDGTLYTSPAYVFEQVDVQIRHWAKINGWSVEAARKKMETFRKEWSASHGGKKISLGNAFTHFGISIQESIKWRNELLKPELFLKPNLELAETLDLLKSKYKLVALTNNPVLAAKKNLRAIGIESEIQEIIGLDTCFKSKPNREMLDLACKLADCDFEQMLSVGDRFDIDLSLPLEMGMGGVLVSGAEDVILLAGILGLRT